MFVILEDIFSKNIGRNIYILDEKHILIHGNSNDSYFDKLLSNINIEAVITDPPYGINLLGSKGGTLGKSSTNYKAVHGDTSTLAFRMFYEKRIVGLSIERFAIFGGNYFADFLPSMKGWVTWDKKVSPKLSFSRSELLYTTFSRKTDVIDYKWSGSNIESEEKEYNYKRFHPTQKPIGVLRRVIRMLPENSNQDSYIFDGFGGSCSLTWAAEMEGKKSICFELDEDYILQSIEVYKQLFPNASIRKIVY